MYANDGGTNPVKVSQRNETREFVKSALDQGEYYLFEETDYELARFHFQRALDSATVIGMDTAVLKANAWLGETCFFTGEYARALDHYFVAKEMGNLSGKLHFESWLYGQIGSSYLRLGDFKEAYHYQYLNLDVAEAEKDSVGIANAIYLLGNLDVGQEKWKEALKKFKTSLRMHELLNNKEGMADCLSAVGDIYHELDSLPQSLHYKGLALEMDRKREYTYGIAYDLHSLGETYKKMGEYQKAKDYLQEALEMRIKIGDKEEIVDSRAALGELYSLTGDPRRAITILKEALSQSRQLGTKVQARNITLRLADVLAASGNHTEAFIVQKEYIALKDSLVNESQLREISRLNSRYEIQKREQEIALLKQDQKIAMLQKDKSLTRLTALFLLVTVLFLSALAIVGYNRYQAQIKSNLLLEEKNHKIREQNEALEKVNRKLTEVNEDLQHFAYVVSHDLKEPLRMISTFTGLIQMRSRDKLDAEAEEFMGFVVNGVVRMKTMLNDLLSYSRLSTKELPKEKVEVDAVLQTVRDNLRISIQSQQAEIIERRLPPVMANSSHLIQLFQNLIANSLKFSHPDRKPEIHIGAEQMGGMVRFSVTDNGMGIEPENQEKVFGMFQRSHSVEKINGTGIGLAVCRKVVEKYGGEIRLESTYGEGTTFVFTLPAA